MVATASSSCSVNGWTSVSWCKLVTFDVGANGGWPASWSLWELGFLDYRGFCSCFYCLRVIVIVVAVIGIVTTTSLTTSTTKFFIIIICCFILLILLLLPLLQQALCSLSVATTIYNYYFYYHYHCHYHYHSTTNTLLLQLLQLLFY